jgi:putative ABC transport system ATP-binding protein/lipoprotein-releasing system ATP-binding protein
MITLREVTKTYTLGKDRSVEAVRGVSLEVQRGEFVIITGRSGSGKTTLLNLVAGMTRPTSGQVLLEDTDLWRLSDREQSRLRNRKLGFVFQFPSLLPSLTALENVVLPTMFWVQNGPDPYQRATQLLEEVGLQDKLASYPRQLSAGQQQRVVVARALMNSPELLLADEPTSDLDEQTEQEIMSLFREIHARTGVTILLVTHTSQLVSYGTKALRMSEGLIADSTG